MCASSAACFSSGLCGPSQAGTLCPAPTACTLYQSWNEGAGDTTWTSNVCALQGVQQGSFCKAWDPASCTADAACHGACPAGSRCAGVTPAQSALVPGGLCNLALSSPLYATNSSASGGSYSYEVVGFTCQARSQWLCSKVERLVAGAG